MVSASKAARDAKKLAEGKPLKKTLVSRAKKDAAGGESGDSSAANSDDDSGKKKAEIARLADQMDKDGLSDRVTTGVLSSLKQSRDTKVFLSPAAIYIS